ncbi:hypothetical protein PQX77_012594 [Marasmius sp. AFHP31]|nr:hypothetical protein PQX77_012594 [Marasmius sp. AFHP31]
MSSNTRQIIFLVGATGNTGASIARVLTKQPEKFKVKALIRSSSIDKPIIQELKSLGVEIVPGDIVGDSQETLAKHLEGVDTLIITIVPIPYGQQDNLLLAAKAAGIKRVVPSDFGPYAPPGSMQYQDSKVLTQKFMIENNIPYTFIQVGVWADVILPFPHSFQAEPTAAVFQKQFHGSGTVKSAYTPLERVGEFVARIISDERTLNRTVQAWDGETTLNEVFAVASKVTGENFDDYHRLSLEEVQSQIGKDLITTVMYEYSQSLWFRGDNTVENAVAAGALDARVLYPDYVPLPLEEFAKKFYNNLSEKAGKY